MRNMTGTSSRAIAAIVGVGPNLGRSLAQKFSQEGYTVAILSRDLVSAGRLSRIAEEIARGAKAQVFAIRIDCSDPKSIREAFEAVLSIGFVEVLVYNAYQPVASSPSRLVDIDVNAFEKSVAVSSIGAFHCAQQVIPGMVERERGTILFSGCSTSLHGVAGYSDLCCGKFALRGLAQSLAREFQSQGVHVAHVIIDGIISSHRVGPPSLPSTSQDSVSGGEQHHHQQLQEQNVRVDETMDPDTLAQTFWYLHTQDRAAWTQEIDLRPTNRRFF